MQGYCMKCRTKREMQDAKSITMKNGRPATQGKCPVCGTKIFKIGKSQSRYQGSKKSYRTGWANLVMVPSLPVINDAKNASEIC